MEIEANDDGIYSFNVDEHVFTIHDLDACDRIVLAGDLGVPPPENKERLYKTILEAQHLFKASAGATFSIDPETGNFTLCKSLMSAVLDDEGFFSEAESFLNTLHTWADIIRDYRAEASKPEDDTLPDPFGSNGFMAV